MPLLRYTGPCASPIASTAAAPKTEAFLVLVARAPASSETRPDVSPQLSPAGLSCDESAPFPALTVPLMVLGLALSPCHSLPTPTADHHSAGPLGVLPGPG